MENSPLNKAHQQQRCAERLYRHRKYTDCIQCYENALKLLELSRDHTTNSSALESIHLQIDSILRGLERIQVTKKQHNNSPLDSNRNNNNNSTEKLILQKKMTHPTISSAEETTIRDTVSRTLELQTFLINNVLTTYRDAKKDPTNDPLPNEKNLTDIVKVNDDLKASLNALFRLLDERNLQISSLDAEMVKLRNEQDEKSGSDFKNCNYEDNGRLLELPPLDVPKFDFEAVKNQRFFHDAYEN